ncbi:hypothetical protein [Actinobaculum suis]|uniref:hypothetical protein n=1 Tax=Actinobaculum suis TaxID=1657 RepID=UPI0008087AAF|nr:hypothetical protein [Actinobaculum suis]OCA94874.1 hypothetical protein ACU20_05785 [Actinobaculum suis]OCA95462.1 hypothetical protein ACU21_04005 [Actinobaculum suis]
MVRPYLGTHVVAEVWAAAKRGAKRPIDHVRRCTTGLLWGLLVGEVVALMWLNFRLASSAGITLLVITLLLLAALASPWWLWRDPKPGPGADVVARVLGTDESSGVRTYKKSRGKMAVFLPVVVRPVAQQDGSADFRTVVAAHGKNDGSFHESAPGTLMALRQIERGYGELENSPEISPEQQELIDKLARRPKLMANNPPVLPFKTGSLERSDWVDQLEWWGGIAAGVAAGIGLVILCGHLA